MGVALLDNDRDGTIEFFISGTSANRLYRNAGERNLVDMAGEADIALQPRRHAVFALRVRREPLRVDRPLGHSPRRIHLAPDEHPVHPYLFINQHNGRFRDAGEQAIDTPIISTMMTCGDLASDGHVACFAGDARGTFLLRNQPTPAGNWVGIRCVAPCPRRTRRARGWSFTARRRRSSLRPGNRPRGATMRETSCSPSASTPPPRWRSRGRAASSNTWRTWPPAGAYTTVTETQALPRSPRAWRRRTVRPSSTSRSTSTPAAATTASIERTGAGTWVGPTTVSGGLVQRRPLRAPDEAGVLGSYRRSTRRTSALRVRPRVRFVP